MNQIRYSIIFLLIVLASNGCKKLTDFDPQSVFVKLFPDSSYQTGGAFQLSDGNYIIYGYDPYESGVRPLVIKSDPWGNIIWHKKLSSLFHFVTIKPTLNGQMLAVGVVNKSSMNFCLIDADGGITILPSYIDVSVTANALNLPDFVEDGNGEFSICGTRGSDSTGHFPFILGINQAGVLSQPYDLDNLMDSTTLQSVRITHHKKGYSVTGTAKKNKINGMFNDGMFYVCLDKNYKVVWDTIMSDLGGILSVRGITMKGNDSSTVILCGNLNALEFAGTLYVRTVNTIDSTWGEPITFHDYPNFGTFNDINNTKDGGYILVGTVNSADDFNLVSYSKIYLLKLNCNLDPEWWRQLDSLQFNSTSPYSAVSAIQTIDDGYLVSGFEHRGSYVLTMLMVKTDANGNIVSN